MLGAADTVEGRLIGYAQQLFTRLVDQQCQSVFNSVRSADTPQPSPKPASS